MTKPAAFISYLHEDSAPVNRLAESLRNAGINVWLDRDDIEPGVRWKYAIRKAIKSGSAFIACFSAGVGARESTYLNEELTQAVEQIRLRPADKSWFFPVRLDECQIADRIIGGGEWVSDLQSIDLYPDFDAGAARLIAAISKRGTT